MKGLMYFVGMAMVVLLASQECWAMDEAEGKAMLKGMASECKEKEGATDADVDDMVDKKIPTSRPAKCLNACMMDQFGVMADDKFVPEGLVEVSKLATDNDEELVKIAEEIAEECKGVEDLDRCELALKLMQCMEEGAKKRGMKN